MKISRLILSCLLTNVLITSQSFSVFAETALSRYEYFKNGYIVVNDNTQLKPIDIEIEGNTLVSPMRNPSFGNRGKLNMIKMDNGRIINDSTTGVSVDNNYYMIESDTKEFLTLKTNTTYTIFISGKVSFSNSNEIPVINPFYRSLENGSYTTKAVAGIEAPNNTYFNETIVFTTDDNEMESFGFYITPSRTTIGDVDIYFHIVEGNVQNEQIPYFEGIKSVGEKNNLESSITITSQNKNISAPLEYGRYGDDGEYDCGEEVESTNNVRSKDFVRVNPGDILTYSNAGVDRGLNVYYYDANKNFMYKRSGTSSKISIPNGCYYIRYYHFPTNSDSTQLEHGNTATDYTEALLNQKTIKLNEPLRKLPNGIKDRIIKKDGQWVVERKLKEVTLNGSEDWQIRSSAFPSDTTQLFCYGGLTDISRSNSIITGDRFKNEFTTQEYLRHKESIFISENGSERGLYLRISNSRLNTLTIEGLKEWLRDNPLTVIYQLAEPIYEPLNIDSSLDIYEDRVIFKNDSEIPANMLVSVDRVINIARDKVVIARNNPSINNLSQARYWINLIDESTIKDQLQENINNIYDVIDMTIDKKTVSSNVDLYIKSNNTLSLSLDTNSIRFENFSGVDDMEKLNAVNLTVSSSLPYKINAYLTSEIQNADKTNIMDRNILSIKANNKSTYNTFIGTVRPIVLLDDQLAGNDIVHGIDFKLKGNIGHKKDVYKTVIKFEVEQK